MYRKRTGFACCLIASCLAANLIHAAPDDLSPETPDAAIYDIEARVITVSHDTPPIEPGSVAELARMPGASLLTAPRIRVRAGQEAEIMVGEELQYMERREDGTFVLRTLDPDAFAGIRLHACAELMDAGRIPLSVSLRISVMKERVLIPGVELDVGKPVLSVTEVDSRVVATPGEWIMIAGQALTDAVSGTPEQLAVAVRVTEHTASVPGDGPR